MDRLAGMHFMHFDNQNQCLKSPWLLSLLNKFHVYSRPGENKTKQNKNKKKKTKQNKKKQTNKQTKTKNKKQKTKKKKKKPNTHTHTHTHPQEKNQKKPPKKPPKKQKTKNKQHFPWLFQAADILEICIHAYWSSDAPSCLVLFAFFMCIFGFCDIFCWSRKENIQALLAFLSFPPYTFWTWFSFDIFSISCLFLYMEINWMNDFIHFTANNLVKN